MFSVAVSGIELVSFFSQSGLHGEVHFMKSLNSSKLVKVRSILEATIQYPEQSWSWAVHQNPVDYSIIDPVERCSLENVGERLINFDDHLGYLVLPGNESSVWDDVMLNLTGELNLSSSIKFKSKQICCLRRTWIVGTIACSLQRRHKLSNLLHDNNKDFINGAYRRSKVSRWCRWLDVLPLDEVGKFYKR